MHSSATEIMLRPSFFHCTNKAVASAYRVCWDIRSRSFWNFLQVNKSRSRFPENQHAVPPNTSITIRRDMIFHSNPFQSISVAFTWLSAATNVSLCNQGGYTQEFDQTTLKFRQKSWNPFGSLPEFIVKVKRAVSNNFHMIWSTTVHTWRCIWLRNLHDCCLDLKWFRDKQAMKTQVITHTMHLSVFLNWVLFPFESILQHTEAVLMIPQDPEGSHFVWFMTCLPWKTASLSPQTGPGF